ncbi:hypothetical protein HYH03_019131 [Edaphochlamys debaryana]|uniref:Uncharacterized protein n=1 Tax=Edaphochlamys debaryana TaxID=47281 RepID=A0A835XGG9_9CHLO|nr:hypothetical protein HYH03_019131 [Edaphochlamys debaryana]|eukprot:KAG2481911.1 hypothetical protein HYH03_019131 [Edaphochlamys debaryana]
MRLDWGLYRADNRGPLATNAEEARGARHHDLAAQALAEGLQGLQHGAGGAEAPPAAPVLQYLPPGLRLAGAPEPSAPEHAAAAPPLPAPPPPVPLMQLMAPMHIVTQPSSLATSQPLLPVGMQQVLGLGVQPTSASSAGYTAAVLATVATPAANQATSTPPALPRSVQAAPPTLPGLGPAEAELYMQRMSQALSVGGPRWSQPGVTRTPYAETPLPAREPPICAFVPAAALPPPIPGNNTGTGLLLCDNEGYRWSSGGIGQFINSYSPGDIRFCALTPSPGRGGEEERNNQLGPAEQPDTETASAEEEEDWEPVPGQPGQLRSRPPPPGSCSASPSAGDSAATALPGPLGLTGRERRMRDVLSRWADRDAALQSSKARAPLAASGGAERAIQDAKCQELLESGAVAPRPQQEEDGAGPSAGPGPPPAATAAQPPPAPPLVLPPAPKLEPDLVPPPCRPKRAAAAPRGPAEPLGKLSRTERGEVVLSLDKEEMARLCQEPFKALMRRLDTTFATFDDQEVAAGWPSPRETIFINSDEDEDKVDPPDTSAPCSQPRPQRRDDDDTDAGGAGGGSASAPSGTTGQPPPSAPSAPPAPSGSTLPAGTAVHSLTLQYMMELPVTPCPALSTNPGPRLYLPDGSFVTPGGDGELSLCPHRCVEQLETTTFIDPFSGAQKDGDGTGPGPCCA